MIQILINRDGIEATGHAGYGPKGSDIVCAGVSVLCDAFVESSYSDISVLDTDGYMKVVIDKPNPDTMARFSMLVTGLRGLSEDYSEFVHITDQAFKSIKGSIKSSIETITR